jgi:hypothetical protein
MFWNFDLLTIRSVFIISPSYSWFLFSGVWLDSELITKATDAYKDMDHGYIGTKRRLCCALKANIPSADGPSDGWLLIITIDFPCSFHCDKSALDSIIIGRLTGTTGIKLQVTWNYFVMFCRCQKELEFLFFSLHLL